MEDSQILNFRRELDALATIRDELKLKAHLARAEAKDKLRDVERKWDLAEEQLQRAKAHAVRDTALLNRELKSLLSDVKRGLEDIKRSFETKLD